jgi:hypothetical protein
MKIANLFYGLILFVVVITACKNNRTYEEILAIEKSKSARADSLFYGIHFGMIDKDFYQYCFQMNQRGIFKQSLEGVQVQFILREGFEHEVEFKFFPTFENSCIRSVKGSFMYKGWIPFQSTYSAVNLRQELMKQLTKWYGGRSFLEMEPDQTKMLSSYVKIDSNRKITLQETFDGQRVEVLFEDLCPGR